MIAVDSECTVRTAIVTSAVDPKRSYRLHRATLKGDDRIGGAGSNTQTLDSSRMLDLRLPRDVVAPLFRLDRLGILDGSDDT